MAGFFRHIAETTNFLRVSTIAVALVSSGVCAFAQTTSAPLTGKASPQANSAAQGNDNSPQPNGATQGSDGKVSAQPANPRINTTEIVNRLDQELGIDLQATTGGWQRELDRLESDLGRQRLGYSQLNDFVTNYSEFALKLSRPGVGCSHGLRPTRRSWMCLALHRPRVSHPNPSKQRLPAPN
jgi:hypothetical protein